MLRLAQPNEAYFWATHQGAELDLLMLHVGRRVGVDFKRSDAPAVTKSMRIAIKDLRADALYVVYLGEHRFVMSGHQGSVGMGDTAEQMIAIRICWFRINESETILIGSR